jgi:hypothetical protein
MSSGSSSLRLARESGLLSAGPRSTPTFRAVLRELRPGSSLRKIPAALLAEYRTGQQLGLDLTGSVAPVIERVQEAVATGG